MRILGYGLVGLFNLLLWFFLKRWMRFAKSNMFLKNNRRARKVMLVAVLLLGVLSVAIVLRPAFHEERVHLASAKSNLSYLFIVDISASMGARDAGAKSRLEFAQDFIKELIQRYEPANAGLIIFTDTPVLSLPFTSDTTTLLNMVDTLEPEDPFFAQGTDIAAALNFTAKYLSKTEKRNLIIFLLTDGECVNVECGPVEISPDRYLKFYIIGIGSLKGAPISIGGIGTVLRDSANHFKPVITKLNETYLKRIAAENKSSKYYHYTDQSAVFKEVGKIYKHEGLKESKNALKIRSEIYPYLVFLFAILFMIFIFDIHLYEYALKGKD